MALVRGLFRGEHFSSLHFQCDVPAVSVWCVGTFTFCGCTFTFCGCTFTFCVGSSSSMCRPDEYLSLRTFLRFAADALQHRCGRVQASITSTRRWALALRPEHHAGSDQSATRRAASMQDTLSEGTARAAQLAASAVTASAVGGRTDHAEERASVRTRSVVAELRRTRDRVEKDA